MSDLQIFRQETREWLEENCPQSMRSPVVAGVKVPVGEAAIGSLKVKTSSCGWTAWEPKVGLHLIGPLNTVVVD